MDNNYHEYVHYHCEIGCEKAQFMKIDDSEEYYCAMCWFNHKQKSYMVECTPETC